ncbi:MAG: ISL3 family transposase [Bdellovibrionales bacterium]|nr:ISL3 family transposase [Bdellovibrionales bacterium]
MPQHEKISQFLLLPELKLLKFGRDRSGRKHKQVEKVSSFEICPKCATPSKTVYDRRWAKAHDAPIHGNQVWLHVLKRRFYCKTCRKPFTEPVQGIRKGKRTTERFKRGVLWACENFTDLSKVRRAYACSTWTVYQTLYERLETNLKRHINYPWPKTIGIDEHFFSRANGFREFATVLVDYNNKRVRELAHGKVKGQLIEQLKHIPGRENVKNVVLDLSDSYKSFVREFFPNSQMIADKFHVLRLLNPALNRYRKQVTGDKRTSPLRKLLLRNGKKLESYERRALYEWLNLHPQLKEIYHYKEALHGFLPNQRKQNSCQSVNSNYRSNGFKPNPRNKNLRRTLMKWRNEILNYFVNRITNARTEGFNNVAKLIQKRAYGVKSFKLYRLRYLSACA